MSKAEKSRLAAIDKMLDRWEAEDTKHGKNIKPLSDPKPGWDHRKYLNAIYDGRLNK